MDRSAVVSNMLWRYAERFGAQLMAELIACKFDSGFTAGSADVTGAGTG